MATLTPLDPDTTGTVSGVTDEAGGTTNLHTKVTDASDTTYLTAGVDSAGTALLGLSDVNADFESMDTLAANIRVQLNGVHTDDTIEIFAQVFDGNATTTPLSDEVLIANQASSGTFTDYTPSFTIQGTPTKTQWNNAHLRLRWTYTKNMASDAISLRCSQAQVTGTYTQVDPNATVIPGAITTIAAAPAAQPQAHETVEPVSTLTTTTTPAVSTSVGATPLPASITVIASLPACVATGGVGVAVLSSTMRMGAP